MSVKLWLRSTLVRMCHLSAGLAFLSWQRVARLMITAKANKTVNRSLENALLTNFPTETTRQTHVTKGLATRKMGDRNMLCNPETARASSPQEKKLNSKVGPKKPNTCGAWRSVVARNKKILKGLRVSKKCESK